MPQSPDFEVVNLNLAQSISSRSSGLQFDALLINCYPEKKIDDGGTQNVVRRFGLAKAYQFTAGTALGLFSFNNQPVSVIGSTARLGTTSLGTVNASNPYTFSLTGPASGFFMQNTADAYYYNGSSLAQITSANYPANAVPGVAYLDTYTCVLDATGKLWNSNSGDPTTWGALNFITAFGNADSGVACTRYLQYIVCFGTQTMTFLYDNANPTGSPLLRNQSADQNVGCAAPLSVVRTRNTVFWVGQTQQRGRSVYLIDGGIPKPISNTYIDRILAADNLVSVYAYFIEINGHYLYVLTLPNSNLTLVYDMQTGEWHTWSTSALGTGINATQATYNPTLNQVTATVPNHGLTNGAICQITGTASSQFLGTFLVNCPDNNTILYTPNVNAVQGGINSVPVNVVPINAEPVSSFTAGNVGNLTFTPFNQNYFSSIFYTFVNGTDLLLDATSGTIYSIAEGLANDNGTFIYMSVRTETWDGGTDVHKFCNQVEIIGDKIQDTAYIGYTDDDYQTFSYFRPIDLGAPRSQLWRNGRFRRRAVQIIYIGSYVARYYRLQMKLAKGAI